MSVGLKVWLATGSIITTFIIIKILHTGFDERFILFQTIQDIRNVIIFAPICCILFGSIFFQVLQNIFKHTLITACVAIVTYFIALITLLPYSFYACLLLGILALPVGTFHYKLSVTFFGEIDT